MFTSTAEIAGYHYTPAMGPAGGAMLASHLARAYDLNDVLSFDMGGTTAKICLISDGVPERSHAFEVARSSWTPDWGMWFQ